VPCYLAGEPRNVRNSGITLPLPNSVFEPELYRRPPEIVVLGAPGSAKSLICQLLCAELGTKLQLPILKVVLIDPNKIIPELQQESSKLGEEARLAHKEGGSALVAFHAKIVIHHLSKVGPDADACVLDGFPSSYGTAVEFAKQSLPLFGRIRFVFFLDLPVEEAITRLADRRVHEASGRVYHLRDKPPKVDGRDDVTGEPLVHKHQDQDAGVRKRMEVYEKQTRRLRPLFEAHGVRVVLVDAAQPHGALLQTLVEQLQGLFLPRHSTSASPFSSALHDV